MDRIVYPFHRTYMDTIYVVTSIIVTIIVGLPACFGGIFYALAMVGFASGNFSGGIGWRDLIAAGLMGAVLCVTGLTVCLVDISRIYFGSIPYEAVLTSKTFSSGPQGRTKTLQLSEITSISARFTWLIRNIRVARPHWTVTIIDTHQQQIQLLVVSALLTRKVLENKFDYRTMLRDFQQRLPAIVTIDGNVKNFIATGEFVYASPART